MDRLALALTAEGADDHSAPPHVMRVAMAARRAAVRKAMKLIGVADIWLIHTAPKPADLAMYRAARAEVITIDPGMDVCLERASELRPYAAEVISQWYSGSLHRTKSHWSDDDETDEA